MTDLLAGLVPPSDDEPRRTRGPRREPRERTTKPRAKKPPTPPNRVDPGWIHNTAAAFILRALADRKIEVGTIDEDFLQNVPGMDESSPEPAVLLARVIAHVAHRIPGLRRVERRLEGTATRAGFGSDLFALALQLYFRNRDIVAAGITQYRQTREAEQSAKADAAKFASTGGSV